MPDANIAELQDLPLTEKTKDGKSLLSGKPSIEIIGRTEHGLPILGILINTTGRWLDYTVTAYGITIFGETDGDEARLDFGPIKTPGTMMCAYAAHEKDQIEVLLVPFRMPRTQS